MSRQPAESEAPDSSESRAPPRENDLSFEELEEGQVDYEESVTSEAHSNAASARSHTSGVSFGAASARSYGSTTMSQPRRALRTPNPFAERYNPVRALRGAPPVSTHRNEPASLLPAHRACPWTATVTGQSCRAESFGGCTLVTVTWTV
ncbi:hypothetical protein PI125_g24658 [Phytophthora idaei]|nr:hypothetical protein PI125_g24658 [Phytophthora idaei]